MFGFFAARSLGPGETVCLNYETLVYCNLDDEKEKRRAYGERIMAVTVQTFTKWATQIPDKVTVGSRVERTAWIVPAPFCATRYVNDARYYVGDRTPLGERGLQPHQKNVDFEQMLYTDNPRDIVDHKIMRLQALQNISAVENFDADYNAAYMFPQ